MRILVLCLLFLCLPSCGYRFGRGEILERYRTVCVPYVEGDDRGLLTTSLIRTITTRGALAYRSSCADLILKVCLLPPVDENIGFAYAPPDVGDNDFSNLVVANEARLTLTAKVSVMNGCTGECILGPMEITSSLSYDFEPDLSNVDAQAFALGQLEMHNLAQESAFPPLFNLLAEKIIDYVTFSW